MHLSVKKLHSTTTPGKNNNVERVNGLNRTRVNGLNRTREGTEDAPVICRSAWGERLMAAGPVVYSRHVSLYKNPPFTLSYSSDSFSFINQHRVLL